MWCKRISKITAISWILGLSYIPVVYGVSIREIPGNIVVPNSDFHIQSQDDLEACIPRALVITGGGWLTSCQRTATLEEDSFRYQDRTSGPDVIPLNRPFSNNVNTIITSITNSNILGGYTLDNVYGLRIPNAFIWNTNTNEILHRAGSFETRISGSNDNATIFVGSAGTYAQYWRYPADSEDPSFAGTQVIPNGNERFDAMGIANDVNNFENIVGAAHPRGSSLNHAFLKHGSGHVIDLHNDAILPILPAGAPYQSSATAINNLNYVIGYTYQSRYIDERHMYGEVKPRAFWWKPKINVNNPQQFTYGEFHSLDFGNSKALAINNQCLGVGPVLVGYYYKGLEGDLDEVFYPGEIETRPALKNSSETVNIFHEITPNFKKHAFAFDIINQETIDLNDLIAREQHWELSVATSIDDEGRVIGYGLHRDALKSFIIDGICEVFRSRHRQGHLLNFQVPDLNGSLIPTLRFLHH